MLSLLAVSMVGCMHVEQIVTINEDSSGTIELKQAVIKEEGVVNTSSNTELEGLEVLEREPYSMQKDNVAYVGERILYKFNNLDDLKAIGEIAMDKKEKSTVITFSNTQPTAEDVSESTSIEDVAMMDMILSSIDFNLTMKLPGEIISTNGKKLDNKTVTWNVMDNNEEGKLTVEYNNNNHEATKPTELIVNKEALELEKMGILKGTENGLELNNELSRIQGMVIYFRLLNPSIATNNVNITPFTDVPNWAINEINYLYSKGLVKGVSRTELGSNNKMKVNDFTTLALRAIGFDDSKGDFQWSNATDKAVKSGLISPDKAQMFNKSSQFSRGDMSYIAYNTLGLLKEEPTNKVAPAKIDFIKFGESGSDKQKQWEKDNDLEGWQDWTEEEREKDYEKNGFRVIGIY